MAFGFQNCCDTEEYFYLNGIPATVSENEVYQISTLEGVDFCATYTELPELFYQPLTYTLDVMVEQTSCITCLESLPCPETIEVPLDNNVTISNYNECSVLTELPLEVECRPIQPSPGSDVGQIRLQISGGYPPYSVFSANTTYQVSGAAQEGLLTISTQVPPGDYCYDVIDSYNAVISLCCTVNFSPAPLVVSCSSTPTNVWNPNTGSINLLFNSGEPPYTVYYNGNVINNLPLTGLDAGNYIFTITDLYSSTEITCTVTETTPNYTYPASICMSFIYCNTRFYLTFLSAGTENYLPYYELDNPSEIGVSSMTLSANTSFNWFTSTESSNTSNLNLSELCQLSPALNGNISFVKNITGEPTPIGNWTSSGIFGSISANVTNGPCVDNPPSFTSIGSSVCSLDGTTGNITINATGGVLPYTYIVDGFPYSSPIISNLSSGNHIIQVSDGNSNVSNVQTTSVTITPSTTLTYNNPCATLNSNVNSVLPNANIDISITIPTNNWPSNVIVTGTIGFRLGYQYVNTLDYPPDVGDNFTTQFTITQAYILHSDSTQTPIVFGNNLGGGQWYSSPWTYNPVTGTITTWSWGRYDIYESSITLVPGDTIHISYDSQYGTPYLFSPYQRINDIAHLLYLNSDVQSGCAEIDPYIEVYSYNVKRDIAPTVTAGSYITTSSTFGLCPTQPNLNQKFQFSSFVNLNNNISQQIAASVSSPSSLTPFGLTTNNTLYMKYLRTNVTNGSNYVPSCQIRLLGGACLTQGQTYYFRFIFVSKPTTQTLKFSFESQWNYQNTVIAFTINPNEITLNTPLYKSSIYSGNNCISVVNPPKMFVIKSGVDSTDAEFYMQISSTSWI